jgi:hypothetical protein
MSNQYLKKMRLLKNLANALRGISSYEVVDNNVYHHYYKPTSETYLNGKLIECSNTDNLPKLDFQRVMMCQKNIICL